MDATTILPRNGVEFIQSRGNPNRILIDEARMYRLFFRSKLKMADAKG